jgi:general secretion pathway protein G
VPVRRRRRGFTLIELMVTVALVALIAKLAYPYFGSQLNKGRVAQAIADIGQMQLDLERYMTINGKYPTSLATAGMARKDPWGHDYQYLSMEGASVGDVRKDKSLHPLNTDYDLYSMGPDGESSKPLTASKSRDDIIRANNGAFIGVAQDY